jgi:hypothetical protein
MFFLDPRLLTSTGLCHKLYSMTLHTMIISSPCINHGHLNLSSAEPVHKTYAEATEPSYPR